MIRFSLAPAAAVAVFALAAAPVHAQKKDFTLEQALSFGVRLAPVADGRAEWLDGRTYTIVDGLVYVDSADWCPV